MRALALGFLALLASFLPGRADPRRLPWSVDVAVGWGRGPGALSLLEETEAALLSELGARGCFREFRPVRTGEEGLAPGILLELTISDVEEETRHEQSMAERLAPTDPLAAALGRAAVLEAAVHLRLSVVPEGIALREESFRESVMRRPASPGEDIHAAARDEFVREVARRSRAVLCKRASARMEERIRAALGAAP